jgi:predicted nucleotidyltransferase component of viral defense system
MITRDELQEYAKTKNYNLGQAEKDYYQEIILFILYSESGKELVFKGGTALSKCYGLDRFSEDLDFTASTKKDYEKMITEGLKRFLIPFEYAKKENDNSINIVYKIQGPLYTGQLNTACRIQVEISRREQIMTPPKKVTLGLHIREIPQFEAVTMDKEEILAEKTRALITRNKARDLYDIFYLIKIKAQLNNSLIQKKLDIYHIKYTRTKFLEAIEAKKEIWIKEMQYLVKKMAPYNEVKKIVISYYLKK